MTLTSRLSLFFLAALALVLAGFSAGLYALARTHLYRQADERLEAALGTLHAAVDVKRDEVEWEGRRRNLSLGLDPETDQVRWLVSDGQGRVVDQSKNLVADHFLLQELLREPVPARQVSSAGANWLVMERRVQAGQAPPRPPGEDSDEDGDDGPQSGKGNKGRANEKSSKGKKAGRKNTVLLLAAAVSLEPVQATLGQLAWALGGLSAGTWLCAALVGRWFCRRALLPVARMARAVRTIDAECLDQHLPIAPTRDELADLGTAFNDLLARLKESFERQQRFTGDASHQLRTPLTAMLGQIEVALRRDRTADEYRSTLELVNDQAGHLRQIVEMLLFLARADVEARLPELENLDLAIWLPELAQRWRRHLRAADLRLECAADGPLRVSVHAPLLGQLLDNLFDNACKYSDSGTPVIVRCRRDGPAVELEVADAGCGIPPDDVAHVCAPFYRSQQARSKGAPGVGLGLAIVQRIVTAFGGSIAIQSVVGQGTRVVVRLPRLAAANDRFPADSNGAEIPERMTATNR